jgi:outer membrane protein OmpA-like peptidoglycan-associated protein
MSPQVRSGVLAGALAVLVACSTFPDRIDGLEKARVAVRIVEQDDLASEVAVNELAAAREAIAQADEAYAGRRSIELIEHRAYVAQRYADIARERIATARAKEQLERFEAERDEVLQRARARAAEDAAALARSADREAQSVERVAETGTEEAPGAERPVRDLERELADLRAKETERGIVLTLGDVLFDSNGTALEPRVAASLDRLARFMRDFPGRRVMIEGHTDARGPEDYNVQLSERRADSVRDALVARGIGPARIRTLGLGEAYPVASNDTPEGMRENRRVEIVISDQSGRFPGTGERAVAANLL